MAIPANDVSLSDPTKKSAYDALYDNAILADTGGTAGGAQTVPGEKEFTDGIKAETVKAVDGDGMQLQDDGGNVAAQITDGGQMGFPKASRFRATRIAAQTFVKATWDLVEYNVEIFDNLGEYDATTYTFTALEAGFYYIGGGVLTNIAAWIVGDLTHLVIYVNGVERQMGTRNEIEVSRNSYQRMMVNGLFQLAAADTVNLRCYISRTAGNTDIYAVASAGIYNNFYAHRLS